MGITASNANSSQVGTLNGLFKETYGDKVENLIPDGVVLMKSIKFVAKEKQNGNLYHQPVIVAQEHGFSYGGPDGTAFALQDPVAGQVKDATVQGYEFVLRTGIAYGAVSRSQNSAAAFESATKLIVANMVRSFAKRLEIIMLYGQKNIGTVASLPTATTMVITTADWAPGIWSGSINMPIDIYSSGGTLRGSFTISAVDIVLRKLTTTTSLSAAGVVATDYIVHKGAGSTPSSDSKEFPGLQTIMENTGTLFGISAASYDLWKATQFDCGSADLSFQKLNKGLALAVAKGLDTDVKVHVNPTTWAKLNSDQAALRVIDSSYKSETTENGSRVIKFYGQNGLIEIIPNIYVKEGLAFAFPEDVLMRVGSTDVTFKRPGYGDEFFRELNDNAGYELRAYSDQSLFCHAPCKLVEFTGIVNS